MNSTQSLNPKREALTQAIEQLAPLLEQGPVDPTTVAGVVNLATELIDGLEVAVSLPRNVYGPRYDTSNQQFNQPSGDFIQNQHVAPRSVVNHSTEVNVPPSDRFYRLGKNLIISTSGQFAFRPETKQLYTAVGSFELTDTEAVRLESFLHNDYNC